MFALDQKSAGQTGRRALSDMRMLASAQVNRVDDAGDFGISDGPALKLPELFCAGSLRTLGLLIYQKFFGRRDWTRTNDPHHVKVML